MEHPDLVIAWLAERQHEIVSRPQLLAAGVTDQMIRSRVARRTLTPLHRGVYKVGPGRPSRLGLFIAAVFAAGEGATLGYRSAGALCNLRPQNTGPVEIIVSRRGVKPQRGIRIHTTRSLHPDDLTRRDGIPCTTPARTIVDLAAVLPSHAMRRVLENAQIERIFDLTAITAALNRAPGRKGTGTLRTLLTDLAPEPPRTRSDFEAAFLTLIAQADLPSPTVNGYVNGYEVDFHWPDAKLIVETDGRGTHGTEVAFERDRQRDLELKLADWDVIRITWRQLTREPHNVVALLRRRLG